MAWLDTDERSAPSPLATLHILGEQLCPQQSTVALCQPPYPRLPACLLDRNVPSDPVQAILLILRTVTGCGEAGGQRGLCRLSSFAALSFDFQLPLFPWEALGSWAAQGIKAERMGTCRALPPKGSDLTLLLHLRDWNFSSYPLQGRQGREQPEKKEENPTYEAREKNEVQAVIKWDFCLCFTQPLCVPTWSQRNLLCLFCVTQIKTKGPDPATGLHVPPTSWDLEDAQHQAETRLPSEPCPYKLVSDTSSCCILPLVSQGSEKNSFLLH